METPSLSTILFASAEASAHFSLACLEPHNGHRRAKSSFVDPRGEIMHWHDFGDLEGPGWAANSLGGALLLYRWGAYTGNQDAQDQALGLVDHVLEDGFIREDGFVWPYYELAQQRFVLNYTHNNDWLCPGSLAKVGVQMLELADVLRPDPRAQALETAAARLAAWLDAHTPRLASGWIPRRITLEGQAYPHSPTGGPDPIYEDSADGLYLLAFFSALAARGEGAYREKAVAIGQAFVSAGGCWGSINHDTYDHHESVAYSVAFRVLRRAAQELAQPAWAEFAYQSALPALERYRMQEDRQGVATTGLLWMEETWDTAYLWESGEAAQVYLESWAERGDPKHLEIALQILRQIANHHTGPLGFLTEGVDWNNHVTRKHHVREVLYGDINYTEPLLNHLHFIGPTLYYFEKTGARPPAGIDTPAALELAQSLSADSRPPVPGAQGVRYLLRLYYPALETDERLEQSLDFARRANVDGVLLFEASYDMDPALLTADQLRERLARLKAIVPRFREVGQGRDFEVHINMMITLGHVDAGCAKPERFAFQFLVNEHGQTSRAAACPLDPLFQEREAEAYRLAAETGADAVWVDDDTRLILHDIPGMGCFCPRHLGAMAERTGQEWTVTGLASALVAEADAGQGNALREAWFDVQEGAVLKLARVIEQSVHAANPAMRIGLMTVGTSFHAAEGRRTDRLLRVLQAHRPMIRPGSGFWNDWQPAAVIDKTEDCARQIAFLGADVQAMAEVENHPYTPYTKSNRVLALELALDVLAGMPDLTLNLLTSMGGSDSIEPEGTDYAAFLNEQRPFLDALAKEWSGSVRRGVGITCSEDTPRHARLDGRGLSAWMEPRPWEPLLARFGFPIGRPEQAPHWISGEVARAMPLGELRNALKEGAVVDPAAALALLDRGLGEKIGLHAARPVGTAVNEQFTADPLNGHRAGVVLPAYNHIPASQLYTWEVEDGAACVLARWLDVDGQDQGSAMVLLEGAGGERVALLPYLLRAPAAVLMNMAHREQWAAALGWASRKELPCRVIKGANLYPLCFFHPERGTWLIAAANLSLDDLTDAQMELSFQAQSVQRLQPDGQWQDVLGHSGQVLTGDIPAFSLSVWRIQA